MPPTTAEGAAGGNTVMAVVRIVDAGLWFVKLADINSSWMGLQIFFVCLLASTYRRLQDSLEANET